MRMRVEFVLWAVSCGGLALGCPSDPAFEEAAGEAAVAGLAETSIVEPPEVRTAENHGGIRDAVDKDTFGYPLVTADKLEILGLLREERFEELHTILDDYQNAFEEDRFKEDWVFDAYAAFGSSDASLTPLLDDWVKARPEDYTAHLARGVHRVSVGFAERGAKVVSKTSEEQFEGMARGFDRARKDLEKALALRAGLHVAYRARIQMDRTQGRWESMDEAYQAACALTPAAYHVHEQYLVALTPRWGGSYEAMDARLGELAPAMAADPRLATLRGRPDWDRARVQRKDGELAAAAALLDQALTHGPDPVVLVERARVLRVQKVYVEALTDLDVALDMVPQDPTILIQRGRTLLRMDRIDHAILAFEAAEALDPAARGLDDWKGDVAGQLVKMGHREYEAANMETALTHLDRAQKLAPLNAEPHYWKGRVHLKQEDHTTALTEFEQAIARDAAHIEAVRNVDWILAKQGKWDEVVQHWDRFLADNPESGDGYLERAGTYRHKGDMTAARADLDTACRLGQEKACALLKSL